MPTLAIRELVYCTDEKALYIGTSAGNVKLCDADWENMISTISNTANTNSSNIATQKSNLNILSGTVAEQGESLANLLERHTTLTQSVNGHGDRIHANEVQIGSLQNNVSAHGNALTQLNAAISEVSNLTNSKLTASKVTAQAGLAGDADLPAVVTAINNLINAMKASGVMTN